MRFKQVIQEAILTELKMSPSFVKKLASSVEGATAGMEFEMCVPDVHVSDPDDFDSEPDYDRDERTYSIDNVCEFFIDGDSNSRRDIDRLRQALQEEYEEWLTTKVAEDWDDGAGYEACLEYCVEDEGLEGEEAEEEAQAMWADKSGRTYDRLWDDYFSDHYNDYSDSDWIEEEYSNMSDIENHHQITWPHYTEYEPDEYGGLSELASEFSRVVSRGINWSADYHGAKREPGKYVLETDGSVESEVDDTMAGLEFVSPPLPLSEMVKDLEKVIAWAQRKGCETNESTGLHMNVSIPNYSLENLDYVKMALFLGDAWVLQQFDRVGNTYCKSALETIRRKAQNDPDLALRAFEKLGNHMNLLASKIVHSGTTDKYTSINTKDEYIEVRSPGGDWLNEDIGKLTSMLYRIVVAMDAACDEQKYRQEYMTKFYKLLAPMGDDAMQLFAQFKSGALTADEFKVAWAEHVINSPGVKTAAGVKPVSSAAMNKAKTIQKNIEAKSWWKVSLINPETKVVSRTNEVVAKNATEAIMLTRTNWNLPGARYPDSMFTATRDKPFIDPWKEKNPAAQQQVQNIANSDEFGQMFDNTQWDINDAQGTLIHTLVGPTNQGEANRAAAGWLPRNGFQAGQEFEVVPHRNRPAPQERWNRWNVRFSDGRQMPVSARNHHEAEQEAIRQTNRPMTDIDSIVLDTA